MCATQALLFGKRAHPLLPTWDCHGSKKISMIEGITREGTDDESWLQFLKKRGEKETSGKSRRMKYHGEAISFHRYSLYVPGT